MQRMLAYSLERIMRMGWARHPPQLLQAMINNDEREISLSQFKRNATIAKLDSCGRSLQRQFSREGESDEER